MFKLFDFDFKKALLVVFVITLPLVSINIQRRPDDPIWYTKPFSWFGGQVQTGYTNLSHEIRETASLYLNLIDIKTNNKSLLKENSELRAKLSELAELKVENERLSRLLNFQQKAPMKLLAARVTGLDLMGGMGERSTIRINRGSNDGLRKGLAVITFEGVVGYIFQVDQDTAKILVLTDRYAVIDGIVQRSRARGIVIGKSVDRCRLKYLHRADDVKEGDLVVTSGLDNIFPKGFPIGTVVQVEKKNYGIDQKVEIQPIIDSSRLEEVFVVMKVDNEKISDDWASEAPPMAEAASEASSDASKEKTAAAAKKDAPKAAVKEEVKKPVEEAKKPMEKVPTS